MTPESSSSGISRKIEPLPDPFRIDHAKILTDAIYGTTFSLDKPCHDEWPREVRAQWHRAVYAMCKRALEAADPYGIIEANRQVELLRLRTEPTRLILSTPSPPLTFRKAIGAAWRAAWERRW